MIFDEPIGHRSSYNGYCPLVNRYTVGGAFGKFQEREDMASRFRTAFLITLVVFSGALSHAWAQDGKEHATPEIKPMPEGYKEFKALSDKHEAEKKQKKIRGLQNDIAEMKRRLDALGERERELPGLIRKAKLLANDLTSKYGSGPAFQIDKKSELYPKLKETHPLIVYDAVERVLDYEKELEELPARIDEARRALSENEKELKATLAGGLLAQSGAVIDAEGGGELFGKGVTSAHLKACGNGDPQFMMSIGFMTRGLGEQTFDFMGLTMECSGLTGGRRVDFQKVCNEYSGAKPPMTARVLPWGVPVCWPNDRKWRPPEKGETGWGLNGKPLTAVCYEAYYGRPATSEEQLETAALLKYTARDLHVECFYMKRADLQRLLFGSR